MANEEGEADTRESGIDPHIRDFVRRLDEANAAHGAGVRSPSERRAIAEKVRAPWRNGGPEMAETAEFSPMGVRLRLYRPTRQPGLPVMLYIHGGGWTLFSIDTHDRLMREYAARAGIAVLGIDYSLSPEHKFPVALDEVSATLAWMEGRTATLDIDTGRLFIGGDSAGANLAVSACLRRREAGQPRLAGMVLNYGAFDPAPTPSYERFTTPGHMLEAPEMDEFWANYVSERSELDDPLVSPLRADLHDLPPAVMAIAERDILADCNHAFSNKLAAAGVPVETHVYQGATHSFLEAVSIAEIARRALDDQALWIRRRAAELATSTIDA